MHRKRISLSEETIRNVLRDFGVTDKEADIYIFLAKHGTLKGGEIVGRTRTHKAIVYRVLGSLQKKGLVESTLESPARFTAVSFEKVLDSNIKVRQEETARIEAAKNELLGYWKDISQSESEPSLGKFVVIEGNHRIYNKITQMAKETQKEFAVLANIPSLLRADQHGLFNTILEHPLKSRIQFRFLTELKEQDLNSAKILQREILKTKLKVNGRNSDIGLKFSPRMAIRDEEEILFFITPKTDISAAGKDETCLWTNCAELVQTFKTLFEEEWRNSSEIDKKALELETDKTNQEALMVLDSETTQKSYDQILDSAKKEILILTSSEGLIALPEKKALLRRWKKGGVSVRIMAPIIRDSTKAVELLSKFCEVRHVPETYLKTTIVDGKHLFQFERRRTLDGASVAYSNNLSYVEKMNALLHEIWEESSVQSAVTLDAILEIEPTTSSTPTPALSEIVEFPQVGFPTFCSAQAIIHTPARFNMPDMLFDFIHFGEPTDKRTNWMTVALWLNTPEGCKFVPTAIVLSRGRRDKTAVQLEKMNKATFANFPAGENVRILKENEFQMLKQGNTLFVGWTAPIPILPQKLVLPPSFLLFEAYGNSRHHKRSNVTPFGWKITTENDYCDAFVTFISPSLRYTGPGTDGRLHTEGFVSIAKTTNQ